MRIVFMGTPKFAVPILEKIITQHEVVLVVTQPDSYIGRKKILTETPVKVCAKKHCIEVFQPYKIKEEMVKLLTLDFDLLVTAAYGQIIPKKILEYPKYKAINVHGSLLPKYRGGAPIQRAIINGDQKTGITIMKMAPKMDAGDIIVKREIDILDSDTNTTMFDKLSLLGSEIILDVINDIEANRVTFIPQDEKEVTFAYNLTPEDEKITFDKPAKAVFDHIRGLALNPGGYFYIDDIKIKVYNSVISDIQHNQEIGTIVKVEKNYFSIACLNGTTISFYEIKPEGKNLMKVKDYLNGNGRNVIVLKRSTS